MLFSPVDRVKYKIPCLDSVICQVRYPTILRIEAEPPVQFQGLLNKDYPYYEEKVEYIHEINIGIENQEPIAKSSFVKNHEFLSENGDYKINLTKNFMSVSTNNYVTWKEFSVNFSCAYFALIKSYEPSFFLRAGLRYVDVFCRSKLGLKNYKWKSLVQPYILGPLSSKVDGAVISYSSICEIGLEDHQGLARIATSLVKNVDSDEKCLMLDSDFSNSHKMKPTDTINYLDFLHDNSYKFLRWAIKDTLHYAMGPVIYEEE